MYFTVKTDSDSECFHKRLLKDWKHEISKFPLKNFENSVRADKRYS